MPLPIGICVVAAAIRNGSFVWSLPAPARHNDVLSHAREHGVRLSSLEDDQGFLLSDGQFARRPVALRVATKASQLIGEPVAPHVGLFSEDVW